VKQTDDLQTFMLNNLSLIAGGVNTLMYYDVLKPGFPAFNISVKLRHILHRAVISSLEKTVISLSHNTQVDGL
jgi:hypothetical protein